MVGILCLYNAQALIWILNQSPVHYKGLALKLSDQTSKGLNAVRSSLLL